MTWVTRSLLDYRVPVYAELNRLLDGKLHVVFSTEWTPERVQHKLSSVLGNQAIGLSGEKRFGRDAREEFANARVCVPYQPGLFKAIAKTRPDVLIGDGFFRWTPAAIAYRMTKRVPLVLCYERTLHTERNAQWYRTAYRRLVIRHTDAMCCNGRLCVEYTRSLGMPESRITTGHMTADTESLAHQAAAVPFEESHALRQELGVTGCCFLYVGRLLALKGIRELLDGWKTLEQDAPTNATLVVVGDGPEADQLKSHAATLELQRVRFIGPIDYDSLARYYAMADVLVMPTLEDNWSLVVPEAMACGLPILCSQYNGCWPELVDSGKNGWVFDPLDSKSVLHALRLAVDHASELGRMGEASPDMIRQHTPERAARSILEACRMAIARRSVSRSRDVKLPQTPASPED